MNYYPGTGLTIGTAIIGNTVGQVYPSGTILPLCKIYGMIITPEGKPVGRSSQTLTITPGGTTISTSWDGVSVSARLTVPKKQSDKIVSIDLATTETNESGYFELWVLQNLDLTITSPSLKTGVIVNTTGLSSIDLSSKFL